MSNPYEPEDPYEQHDPYEDQPAESRCIMHSANNDRLSFHGSLLSIIMKNYVDSDKT